MWQVRWRILLKFDRKIIEGTKVSTVKTLRYQSVKFQTTGYQSEIGSNHRVPKCNLPYNLFIILDYIFYNFLLT